MTDIPCPLEPKSLPPASVTSTVDKTGAPTSADTPGAAIPPREPASDETVGSPRVEVDKPRARHVSGLDSLRFVAAMWVVFTHVGDPPLFKALGKADAGSYLANAAWGILFSGPAAVIVFFVISGFCIHYPYASQKDLKVVPYLVRRYVRIGIPMLAAMGMAAAVGMNQDYFFYGILWSLVAELIYYTLYPSIRALKSRWGIDSLIVASYLASLLVPLADPGIQGYAVFGWKLNWVLGLPCWLLGVRMADAWVRRESRASHAPSAREVWKWRLYAWGASSFCLTLNYHSAVSYAWTLNLFAFVAYAWIEREALLAEARGAHRVLERVGRWSYSLYLCHMPATTAFRELNLESLVSPLVEWSLKVGFVLASAYLFYLAVEYPSHRLARWLAGRAAAR